MGAKGGGGEAAPLGVVRRGGERAYGDLQVGPRPVQATWGWIETPTNHAGGWILTACNGDKPDGRF